MYSVLVSNALGWVQSADAMLSVTVSPPIIVSQPTNQNISPGGTAIFSVSAIGNQPLSYQWRSNGFNLVDSGNLSGSSSSVLTILNATEGNNATFSVLVSNSLGSVPSTGAVLTVIPCECAWHQTWQRFIHSAAVLVAARPMDWHWAQTVSCTARLNSAIRYLASAPRHCRRAICFVGKYGRWLAAAGLTQGPDGNLYGTAIPEGSLPHAGGIFRMTYSGTVSALHILAAASDGASPYAPLVQGADGYLYGATTQGGSMATGLSSR